MFLTNVSGCGGVKFIFVIDNLVLECKTGFDDDDDVFELKNGSVKINK